MRNPVVQALYGLHGRRSLNVLIYHRVLRVRDPLRPSEPTAGEFESRMRFVKDNFNVVSLVDGVAGLRRDRLPVRALAITFDDGYRDNHDVAMPILSRLGIPATFFIATGYLDGGRMFNDTVIEALRCADGMLDLTDLGLRAYDVDTDQQRCAAAAAVIGAIKYRPAHERITVAETIAMRTKARVPQDLMMTSGDVARMQQSGMQLGAHTATHPILANVDADTARREIIDGRTRLEEIAGEPITLFAYPNGKPGRDYTPANVNLVKELGFAGAVTTATAVAHRATDPFQIPRFTPWDRQSWKFGLRMGYSALRTSEATR
jgi:peptidoglycan/xylan/chitin deacetylase (PgdA/CDA1 family)